MIYYGPIFNMESCILSVLTATQKLQHNFSGMDPSISKPWTAKQPDAGWFLQAGAAAGRGCGPSRAWGIGTWLYDAYTSCIYVVYTLKMVPPLKGAVGGGRESGLDQYWGRAGEGVEGT